MVSKKKKSYMQRYNQRPEVKQKKAAYMRRVRAQKDKEAARDLVRFLLDLGYDDMAYQYALERAPEMLITIKARPAPKRR